MREQSEVDRRLSKAAAFLEQGKQGAALGELWVAEASARMTPDALQEIIDFTTAFRQEVRPRQRKELEDLAQVLRRDMQQAIEPPVTSRSETESSPPTGTTLVLIGLVALVVLLLVAIALSQSPAN